MKIVKLNNVLTAVVLAFLSASSFSATPNPQEHQPHAHEIIESKKLSETHQDDDHNHGDESQNQHGTGVDDVRGDDVRGDDVRGDDVRGDDVRGDDVRGDDVRGDDVHGDEHQEGISFSPDKMALAGIEVETLSPKIFESTIYAPGEIKANGYSSYVVSARTESVVVSRHVTLGENVEKGQPLVTLFSESVAQAQATYRVAFTEWNRVKKLTKNTVSESRLLAAQTDYIAAYSRLKAFGLIDSAIAKTVANTPSSFGEYVLIAQRSGAVLSDDFSQGQRVAAGDEIMVLADEVDLWVEARVSPNKKLNLPIGTKATLELGNERFVATVIQEAHTIDPITRTRIVRLAVKNLDDRLHPGMFVDVNFSFDTGNPVMAVPETALMRGADGDWTVFVEDHPGEFKAVEVILGQALGLFREISGIAPKTRIVTQGAFFVASEIAKGGFDPHGH